MLAKDCPEYQPKEYSSIFNLLSLKGKTALITGAAGGIGRSTAKAFAELGANVALMDIPPKLEALQNICQEIEDKYHVKALAVTGDVSQEESVLEFVGKTEEYFGTIDILHNNAGIAINGDSPDIKIEDWNRVIGINLTGMMLVGRTVANVMIKHKNGGSIINTASMSAHIINTKGYSYAATKAGVMHMTKAMAAAYVDDRIRVNSISPGVILSGIHDMVPVEGMQYLTSLVPMKRLGSLDDIAGMIAVMASDVAAFMTGEDILVDGGQTLH